MSQSLPEPAPAAPPRVRVLLVDDHPLVRQGLAKLINEEPDMTVCAEVASAEQAIRAIATERPDIAVVDISLDGFDGIELIKEVRGRDVNLPMLVLSMHDESLYAERVLRAGGRGYVTKQEAPEQVMTAIRRVLAGGIYVSETMSARLLNTFTGSRRGAGELSPLDRLSDRELQVFRFLGGGLSIRQIAERLTLSAKTIETHREHIKEKLGLKSSGELLRYAIQHALDQT